MEMDEGLEPPDRDARMWAMWCHLSALSGLILQIPFANLLVPFIIWRLKREDHPFIDQQGREALNFQISIFIYTVISVILILALVGILLLIAVYLFGIVCVIIAAIRANDGEHFRYPLTIRFL